MKTVYSLVLILLLILSGCIKEVDSPICTGYSLEMATITDTLEYKIIEAVIRTFGNQDFVHVHQNSSQVVGYELVFDILKDNGVSVDSLMLVDLANKGVQSENWDASLFGINSVKLIGSEEMNCLFSNTQNGWEGYYKKYPDSNGFFTFARPGIHSNNKEAVLEYGWHGGMLAGAGYVVLLEEVNGEWQVKQVVPTWVA